MIDSEAAVLAYAILCCTALCAVLGAPWWAALVGGSLLALQSIVGQRRLRVREGTIDAVDVLAVTQLASLAAGWIAGAAAWLLGKATVLLLIG
jgi:hypothetical protein